MRRAEPLVSPKLSLVLSPHPNVDLFVNAGRGFHSNDARSTLTTAVPSLFGIATGGELGTRIVLAGRRIELSAALWRLDLSSELVFVGDTGDTEASDATIRQGVDVELRARPLPWLAFDAALLLADTRFDRAGPPNAIPLAPSLIASGGVTVRHPWGLSGALRLRHLGDRPATEWRLSDGVPHCSARLDASNESVACALVAEGYTVADLQIGWESTRWAASLTLENLTNAVYREAQFGSDSRVLDLPHARTTSASGAVWKPEPHPVRDLHYTPGSPLSIMATLTAKL
jgi:outer membrane receptor protein involved in Fe transport